MCVREQRANPNPNPARTSSIPNPSPPPNPNQAQCSTAGNFFLRLGGGVETSRFMFQHREHCAAMNDDVGQPLGVALEKPNLSPNPNPNPNRNPLTPTL